MAIINDEIMRLIIKLKYVVLIGTVDSNGMPNISPRFVLGILENKKLLFADAFENKTFNNTKIWPKATVAVIDMDSNNGYQLKGELEEIKDYQLVNDAGIKLKEFGIDAKPVRVWALNVKEIYSLIPSAKSKKPLLAAYA